MNVAIVTGGAQGIGRACAEKLIATGSKVALWDLDVEASKATAAEIGALAVQVDITNWDSVADGLEVTEGELGPVTQMVNSAGIAGPNMSIEDYPRDDWELIMKVNVTGTFHMLQAVLPGMKARNYGRVALIASVAGKEGNPNASAYSTSKAAVIGLTKSAGKECASFDVAVNCITPAAARTRIFDQMSEEHINYMLSKIPRERFVKVEEVADMIGFMVSKENSFTTGAVFDASGGRATY